MSTVCFNLRLLPLQNAGGIHICTISALCFTIVISRTMTYISCSSINRHAASCSCSYCVPGLPGSLLQDAFGNYVVQYVLELGQIEAGAAVMHALESHYAELSMQKFSSNVVEKCLKLGGLQTERETVVREIIVSPLLPRLLQDSYGNYVVQSSLTISSGSSLHQDLVDAIKPYLPALRGTPHGKRILQKVNGKV